MIEKYWILLKNNLQHRQSLNPWTHKELQISKNKANDK